MLWKFLYENKLFLWSFASRPIQRLVTDFILQNVWIYFEENHPPRNCISESVIPKCYTNYAPQKSTIGWTELSATKLLSITCLQEHKNPSDLTSQTVQGVANRQQNSEEHWTIDRTCVCPALLLSDRSCKTQAEKTWPLLGKKNSQRTSRFLWFQRGKKVFLQPPSQQI